MLRVADLLRGGPVPHGTGDADGGPTPPDRHEAARTLCPGDPEPAPGAWRAAWADVLAEDRASLSRAGLGWVLTRLASGAVPGVDLLEVGCERLRLSRVTCDAAESGPRTPRITERSWSELPLMSAVLPAERARRLLLLAGAGPQGAAAPTASLGTALHDALCTALAGVLRAASRDEAVPLVLAVRAAGWQPLERAAESVRADSGALLCLRLPAHWPAAPDDLTAELPLPSTVWLAAAHGDGGSAAVGLVRRPLFPAGSRAGDRAPAGRDVEVAVSAPPAGAGPAVAAVVRGPAGEPAVDWRPVRMDRLALAPGSGTTLAYSLHAGHRVELRCAARHEPEATAWADLAAATARQPVQPYPVDLLLAVEIAGPRADGGGVVEARLREAAAVVTAVRAAVGDEPGLRVGLFGYRDHDPLHRPGDHDPVVHRVGMCTAAEAVRVLASWHPHPLRHDFATGLEHLPGEIRAWRHLWRADSHRVLLTVGSRPPHPPARPPRVVQRGAPVRICPDRLDWQSELRAARRHEDIVCLAVVDEPAWMGDPRAEPHLTQWAQYAWHAFGAEGRFSAGHDPERIAAAVTGPALCPPHGGTPVRLVVAGGPAGDWHHAVAG
ncbi:hypothetical protein [Streptomyces zinciresistens]|nr:hypothetical protein [Streptomyces zinciresistens]